MKRFKTFLGLLMVVAMSLGLSITVIAEEQANYRVVFYDENGTQIKEVIRQGKVGETVSAEVDDMYGLDNYDFDPSNVNMQMDTVVKADGTAQISIYFKSKSDAGKANYTVKWMNGTTVLKSETRKAEPNTTVSIIGVDTDAIEVDGTNYEFDMENANNKFSTEVAENGTSELKIYMKPIVNTGDINDTTTDKEESVYTILWLKNEGTEIKKDIRKGVVGEMVSIDPDDIEPFDNYVFDADNANNVSMIDSLTNDGKTELRIYFKLKEDTKNTNQNPQTPSVNEGTNSGDVVQVTENKNTTSNKPVFTPVVKETNNEVAKTNETPKVMANENQIESVKTGDTSPFAICLFGMFASIGAISFIMIRRRYHR